MPYLVPELSRMVTEIFITPLGHTAPRLGHLFFSTQSRVQPQCVSQGLPCASFSCQPAGALGISKKVHTESTPSSKYTGDICLRGQRNGRRQPRGHTNAQAHCWRNLQPNLSSTQEAAVQQHPRLREPVSASEPFRGQLKYLFLEKVSLEQRTKLEASLG